jgi:hypothetical protein
VPDAHRYAEPFSGHGDDVFERLAADKAVDVSGNIV